MTEYRRGPDGSAARVVGAWAAEKQHYVGQYMTIFARGMSKSWPRRVYVDLFAGPGMCVTRGTDDFFDGSPLIALQRPFTDHIYVDLDPVATESLERRVSSWRNERAVHVIQGDCNDAIDRVIELIPKNAIVFAFIDPTNWQIRFETVRKLCADRRVDILLTFQVGMLKRNRMVPSMKKVDAFFGTTTWRPALDSGEQAKLAHFATCYGAQMVSLGYLDVTPSIEPKMRISTHTLLYTLRFYSKHERGHEFWEKIARETPTGQMHLVYAPVTPPGQRAPAARSAASRPRSAHRGDGRRS